MKNEETLIINDPKDRITVAGILAENNYIVTVRDFYEPDTCTPFYFIFYVKRNIPKHLKPSG